MKHLHIVLGTLLLVGAGCISRPDPVPIEPSNCPDVCAAVCAGEPEPTVPAGCAMPLCACEPLPPAEM